MDTDSLESILVSSEGATASAGAEAAAGAVAQMPEVRLPNTKFCYYNNYSLSQPKYFCKLCRRYWTNGGTLRNILVGGGYRKKKRVSSTKRKHDLHFGGVVNSLDSSDLALTFASFQNQDPSDDDNNNNGPHHFGSDDHVLDMNEYNVGNDIRIPSLGFLDSITRGLFENGCTNLGGNFYSGEGDYDHVAAMKRELSTSEEVMLLGFPWEVNANSNGINGSLSPSSSALVSCNRGLNSSSWPP